MISQSDMPTCPVISVLLRTKFKELDFVRMNGSETGIKKQTYNQCA